MAFANASVSDIIATTIESRSGKIADNVTKSNALLARLQQKGRVKPFSGGTKILEELSFAENSDLKKAKIKNGAGEFVELTGESAGKTIAGAKVKGTGNDLALDIDYATTEAGAYPIVLVTYEIACSKGSPKAAAIKGFLSYTASTGGQSALAELGYAPLPEAVRSKVETSVAAIS